MVYGHLSGQHATPTRGAKRLGHPGSVIGDERLLCYSNYDYAITKLRIYPRLRESDGGRSGGGDLHRG